MGASLRKEKRALRRVKNIVERFELVLFNGGPGSTLPAARAVPWGLGLNAQSPIGVAGSRVPSKQLMVAVMVIIMTTMMIIIMAVMIIMVAVMVILMTIR